MDYPESILLESLIVSLALFGVSVVFVIWDAMMWNAREGSEDEMP